MSITGDLLIGSTRRRGSGPEHRAINPTTGETLEPGFAAGSAQDAAEACVLAGQAFDAYRALPLETRAAFLDAIAQAILDLGDTLVDRVIAESGLLRGRVEGERNRTVGQLRLFAQVVRDGHFLDARIDPALPDRTPAPRPDLRLRNIPLGPVAVFGASNFPLAFSVAGGDTASALAAGCPVVVKAHSAHPGASELVGRAIQQVVAAQGLPGGVFSLVFGAGSEVGQALVAHPAIKAVGFTGSRGGGTALMAVAAARHEPIPVYAEMSSINPVLLMPGALTERAEAIGKAFVASLTLGAGQFCTNPGLLIAIEGEGLDRFLASAGEALETAQPAVMLTPGIHRAYCEGVARLSGHATVREVARGVAGSLYQGTAALFAVTAQDFLAHPELAEEVFGAAGLVVRCPDAASMAAVLEGLEGQLTAALHMTDADGQAARELLPLLERKSGRILVNGFGTGVEVAHAMVHGGPYPSTSDGRSTSVGSLAIRRFLRPVCYQDLPPAMLPPELQSDNPLGLSRLVDGKVSGALA
jgi:alpha-ketoglutaric semialdehyde dehydrogenase